MILSTFCKNTELVITLLYCMLAMLTFVDGNIAKGVYYIGVTTLMIGLVMMR